MPSFDSQGLRISYDDLGDGESAKPGDPAAYRPEGIAGDVARLLQHLQIRRASLFGYSMGGRNAVWLLQAYPSRFLTGVIAGVGMNLLHVEDPARWTSRGFHLTADNAKSTSLAAPGFERMYGHVAHRGGRLGALAACLLGGFPSMRDSQRARVRAPTLVVRGARDTLAGSPIPLAESIPGARAGAEPCPGRLIRTPACPPDSTPCSGARGSSRG
jgi:pimeloyl-ACP methyl ester carboxylesterase